LGLLPDRRGARRDRGGRRCRCGFRRGGRERPVARADGALLRRAPQARDEEALACHGDHRHVDPDSADRRVLAARRRAALSGGLPVTAAKAAAQSDSAALLADDRFAAALFERVDVRPTPSLPLEVELELPNYVQIEPVGQCNLRCRMCAIRYRKDGQPPGPPAFMDFDVFTRLVDQMDRMAVLHLQGLGEPMMHPRFFDMVEYAVGKGVRVTTNTNLTLLNRKRAIRAVESGLAELHASLDGASAGVYEAIRTRARYSRVVANLEGLLAVRRARAVLRPSITIVFVVMRRNVHELP